MPKHVTKLSKTEKQEYKRMEKENRRAVKHFRKAEKHKTKRSKSEQDEFMKSLDTERAEWDRQVRLEKERGEPDD